MLDVPLRASAVGLTARCDRHVDVADTWTALSCPACQVRIIARAREELYRERYRKGVEHDPRD